MKHLLQTPYIPYGSQYYRAPSPRREDWDRDLSRMAELGFTMVKYWVQWRWNTPEEGRYRFDDIDALMDLAERHGLKVMLNTIVDVAPAWIYRKYPDASMLTLDGRRIGPQTQPHRQIGGLGLCLNHPEAIDHMFDFLAATLERYKEHPALEIWNVGSEPELTQSMSEMRRYADDAARMGDMLCHCDHCAAGFRRWLERKYGDIGRLNEAWNRNYGNFDDAELPKTRNTFNDVVDWRMFFVHTLGENVRRRFDVARAVDAGRHPLMCHHVFVQGFPVTSTANDPWNVGQYGDLHGFTQMDDAMMHDILRSCARGKPVISAEMLMLMGYTLDLPRAISADDIKRHIFTGLAANVKGFLFWQYRPETLGREAPTWGLAHLDGSSTPWLESFAEIGRALQADGAFLLEARPAEAQVALVYSPENEIFAWAATGSEKSATDSLLGAHRALYDANITVDFLHPREITDAELLSRYRVILFPFPYWMSAESAEALRSWVKAGGVLIGEANFAGWHVEEGRHQTTLPGYGLHEMFGVRQEVTLPADEGVFWATDGLTHNAPNVEPRAGVQEPVPGGGYVATRPMDVSGGLGQIEMVLRRELPGLPAGAKLYGAKVKETYRAERADVLAEFNDGRPAVTASRYGDGTAILIGSYVGLSYHRSKHPSNAAFLAGLVQWAADLRIPRVVGRLAVRVDVLKAPNGKRWVIVQNNTGRAVEATVHVPSRLPERMTELFSEEEIVPGSTNGSAVFEVGLPAKSVKIYRG